jgi:hypothetical protein
MWDSVLDIKSAAHFFCSGSPRLMISELTGVESAYEISDVLWDRVVSLLSLPKEEEESWSTKNERQEGYECYFLCFT